jgi:hypothetical protein
LVSLVTSGRRVFKDNAYAFFSSLIHFWVYMLDVVCGGRGFILVGQNPVANWSDIWLDPHHLAYIFLLKWLAHPCVLTLIQSSDILALHQCPVSELCLFGVWWLLWVMEDRLVNFGFLSLRNIFKLLGPFSIDDKAPLPAYRFKLLVFLVWILITKCVDGTVVQWLQRVKHVSLQPSSHVLAILVCCPSSGQLIVIYFSKSGWSV